MDICTIIAKNYVAQARVLATSFAEHHPGGRCFVLVIDDYEGYIDPEHEPFAVLTPAQIGCAEFEEMALRYTILELSTAVKPWLLDYLLSRGSDVITYLDPDIRVYSSLEALDELARAHTVVLTPHNTVPLPEDGERPSQVDILLAGVYNLGYVSLAAGKETERLLRWWRERLLNDCRVDPLNGYFVDQRWFDLAPGLVSDRAIVRSARYNVAYWNLHSRALERDGSGYTVDGEPLAFFHFSGFDPRTPRLLSRHQTRISMAPGGALERICGEYAEQVLAAGYEETQGWPYTYDALPGGVTFDRRLRMLYAAAQLEGAALSSPFEPEGTASFMSWLARSPPGAAPGLNRVLADLHGTRGDLQEAFPEVARGDYAAFLSWAAEVGVREEPVLTLLAPYEPASDPAGSEAAIAHPPSEAAPDTGPPAARSPSWGVNVVGYFRSELGTGEAARQVISALDAGGVPVLPVHGRTIPPNRQGHAFTHLDHSDSRYPVNLICMNADMLGEFAEQAGREFFAGRYTIGMWFWEVEKFPEVWMPAFDHLDEVWVASDHMARAIGAVSSVPVTKVTLPVEMPPVLPATRAELELPEGFMFLFSFDHHSVFERKNPLAVVEAYKRAFGPEEGAVLVIKSINADAAPGARELLLDAAGGRADVHVLDGYLAPDRKNLMVASCDCYVSLHRAEGFGLTMAEAMYLDKPVVATGYSGNLDFMTGANSHLVDYRLVEIGPNAAPYPPDGLWAEPDVAHAARLMREVFDDPGAAAELGRRGGRELRTTHSASTAGAIMRRRLESVREQRQASPAAGPLPGSRRESLEHQLRIGPAGNAAAAHGAIRRFARRLWLRALKPYSAYQRTFNEDLLRSLSALEARIQDLDLDTTERHAGVLAALRNEAESRALWQHVEGLSRSAIGLQAAVERLEPLADAVQYIESQNNAIPYMDGSPFGEFEHPRAGLTQGFEHDPSGAPRDLYRTFEDTFRGSEKLIRDRQRIYLELLGDRAPVLDLGCGRGEFLDLLAEQGVPGLGVDSDPGMVRHCHEKGHTQVIEGDALEYLESFHDGELGVIFCAQVIEHLPYPALLRLFSLAREKLSEDGMFVAETVNPHCTSALKTFWVDPTHQHPIFPEVALQLASSAGFSSGFVFHPNGHGDVRVDRFTQGEYALVAGGGSLLAAPARPDATAEVGEHVR